MKKTNKKIIEVVGLGEIGSAVIEDLKKKEKKCIVRGVDVDQSKIKSFARRKFNVASVFQDPADVYIIAVYHTNQVIDVIRNLDLSKKPLIVIESTILPGTTKQLVHILDAKTGNTSQSKKDYNLVIFPHRFYAKDPTKRVFNLDRVMGGLNKESMERGMKFFSKYMSRKLIHQTTYEIAELTKVVENAYRFVEIAVAEELKVLCDIKGIDFKKLRTAANTKWNIEIKDALDGIGGHCLKKDIDIFNQVFGNSMLFHSVIRVDDYYKLWKNGKQK
jgi:UDP-N-acetyl-D-glucosamine dehydrogenase